jgi:hypothetical protein
MPWKRLLRGQVIVSPISLFERHRLPYGRGSVKIGLFFAEDFQRLLA